MSAHLNFGRTPRSAPTGFKLYGIFGFPLAHTLSPVMQEAAFRAAGIKAFYLPFEASLKEFRGLMRGRKRLLLDGFNITVPYKGEAWKILKPSLTQEALSIQAVNTVFRKANKWVGANTDCRGFLLSLSSEGHFNPRGKKVFVLGAGGAARAVVYGLARGGAREIWLTNRQQFKARRKKLIHDFKKIFRNTVFFDFAFNDKKNLREAVLMADLVVNATSVGVLPGEVLIPERFIPLARRKSRKLFFDLVYHKTTRFLETAKQKGHRTINGVGMLVYQGAEAFRLWTGKKAPVELMRKAINVG